MKTDEQKKKKKILSKFTILFWATFTAILGHMQPTKHGLDTPAKTMNICISEVCLAE